MGVHFVRKVKERHFSRSLRTTDCMGVHPYMRPTEKAPWPRRRVWHNISPGNDRECT